MSNAAAAPKPILDCPALHFNWGFHDARAEQARGRARDMTGHRDADYARGYLSGLDASAKPIPVNDPAFDGWA